VILVAQKAKRSKNGRSSRARRLPGSVIVAGALLLLLLIGGAYLLLSWINARPVATTYQSALDAFRLRNVSAVIAPDLAADFASGNYTLRELAARYPGFEADIRAVNDALREAAQAVLVSVNGEPITRAALQSQAALLPAQYRSVLTDEQILEEMINEKLLLQDAAAKGITADPSEVEAGYQDLLAKGNLTSQQLEENVASYGLSLTDIRTMLAKQIVINKLFNETVDKGLSVSAADVINYYTTHQQEFQSPATVTVRHILIATGAGNDSVTLKKAEEALAKFKNGTDFCALVTDYSNDAGSKQTCGEYTFGKGVMVLPFEEASFAMAPGETRIVKTVFGYHVILKINETKGQEIPFSKVAAAIGAQLQSAQRLTAYQAYITALRQNATIIYNLPQPAKPLITTENATAPRTNVSIVPANESATKANQPAVVETNQTPATEVKVTITAANMTNA
jgi:peptidyl-prolyl cis-trans isomerase C